VREARIRPLSDRTAGDPMAHLLRDIAAPIERGNAASVMEARDSSGMTARDASSLIQMGSN